MLKKLFYAMVITALAAGSSFAAYVDVTIYDEHEPTIPNGLLEDQELDAGRPFMQEYDLEAFLYDYNEQTLGMVGGFDFVHVNTGDGPIYGGDIFIDQNQDNSWDYAVDLDFDGNIYTIYSIDEDNLVPNPWGNSFSDPFEYDPGDNPVVLASGNFSYEQNLFDAEVGFLGDADANYRDEDDNLIGSHYRITGIELEDVLTDQSFLAHYTMSCGNDFMIASVPEPAMLSVLGIGLLSLAGLARRKRS